MFTTNFAVVKSWLSSSPLALISHGYEVHRGPFFDEVLRAYLFTSGRAIAHGSSAVVAMTRREASRFVKLGVPADRCVTIPPGVDSDFFRPGSGSVRGKRIVWTGRFVQEKNLECLLHAVALLKSKVPDVELVLAGEGSQRPKLMALSTTLGLDGQVSFPGLLSQDGIADLLQTASIYALPSTAEALPIAILEAMSSGLPLIVSKGLGLKEIVDNAAKFADHRDPQQWAQILEALFKDDELRNAMAARARELAVTRYDWGQVADRLEDLFVSIVEGKGMV